MRKLILAAALAVAATLLPAGSPAMAFSSSDCAGGRLYQDYDYPRINGGEVDFGDHLHLGGAPQGNAVVCWGSGRTFAQVKGRLFLEASNRSGCAIIQVDYFNLAGSRVRAAGGQLCEVDAHPLTYGVFNDFVDSSNLARVRIRLLRSSAPDAQPVLLTSSNFFFGDA